MSRIKKGHNLERVDVRFTPSDLQNFKPKQIFNNKWIILKNLGPRGPAQCYEVCDKQVKNVGTLYIEIADDGMSSVVNHVEFLHKQFSVGNSHRFTTILDTSFINNHVYYMVILNRAGPTMDALLKLQTTLSPFTVAFIAIDMISLTELMTSTGYVWRVFDTSQWIFDVKTRTFCLTDPTDVAVISDKRYRSIGKLHLENADKIDLHWKSEDLTYAPISFILHGPLHRMSELDMMETLVYVIYELAFSKLPWKNNENPQKLIEMKTEFMDNLPEAECLKTEEDLWLDTALRNFTEYLKLAHKMEEKFEKQPVRDGAWCPNGARAGALISAVKYREIIDDFHRVVTRGKPVWSGHWRDVKLDWDKEISHTPKSLKILKNSEIREIAVEVANETKRLEASRAHYSIMKEHAEAELELNAESIQNYLDGVGEEEEEEVKGVETRSRKKRRTKLEMEKERKRKEKKDEEEEVEEVEEEVPKAPEKESTSTSDEKPQSARSARLQRRLQIQELLSITKEVEKKGKKNEVKKKKTSSKKQNQEKQQKKEKVICIDEDVKIEEPDDYMEERTNREIELDTDVKIEEPDE